MTEVKQEDEIQENQTRKRNKKERELKKQRGKQAETQTILTGGASSKSAQAVLPMPMSKAGKDYGA